MSEWCLESSKDKYSVLIPKKVIDGYNLRDVIITTFTMHQIQLQELLYEIGAFELIPEGKVLVFYDKSARDGKDNTYEIISEKYLHGISIMEKISSMHFIPRFACCVIVIKKIAIT